jgi:hypothetical protein
MVGISFGFCQVYLEDLKSAWKRFQEATKNPEK